MGWTAEEAVLAHSAKGTSWSKKDHKYVKKVGGKYYYKDDYDRMIRTRNAQTSMLNNAKAAQAEWETGKHKDTNDIADRVGPVLVRTAPYFDRTNPGSAARLNDNMDVIQKGYWDDKTAAGTPQRDAVRAKNEVKNIQKEQEFADENRPWQAKAQMKILTIGDNIISAGKDLLRKLGIKV